ncbi:hypothetical protein [Streptomyces capitiformicae]|uniref:hypothetical protein n=1 Tax=Streptomyces capitiformicae TaxID=2014920 RepID=UPI001E4C2837|nr:hypothetical protein [Streptomyces capitiformicae]
MGWPPALRELKELLYEVYLAAGAPSLDEITGDIARDNTLKGSPSRDTIRHVITHGERSGQQADVVSVATVLARRAVWDAPDLVGRVRGLWVQAGLARGAGRTISELRGDVRLVLDGGLGIHPAPDTGGASERFGILPAYVPRDIDARLKTVVDAAVAGHSGIAVLVGGSSTGKTRALWEAVGGLPEGWRVWHPLTPTAPDAALAALPEVAPKTVVWLNEAQHYLDPEPLGESVAAGLRELSNDPLRAPVLVLGTLWPGHWDTLTTRTTIDRHAGARALLCGHKIDVPDAFTPADLAALNSIANADSRLTQAAQHAEGGQITQYLAGVPYLMDRYSAARGATRALIHAAMDARRMGASLHIPLDWLADAVPGYLTDAEYRDLDDDWLTKALAYATTPCNGIPGILTPAPTRGPRNQRARRRPAASATHIERLVPKPQGPRYLLADYLDQHGRHHRADTIPPIDFWKAAAQHAHPNDLTELGHAAWARGLYRDAAQLHKNAITHGYTYVAAPLVDHLFLVHPTDPRPAQWAAANVVPVASYAVERLVHALRESGAHEQATELAERAAAHTTELAEQAVTRTTNVTPEEAARMAEQWDAMMARDPHVAYERAIAELEDALRDAGAHEQVTALAEWDAAHTTAAKSLAAACLMIMLREDGAHDQVTALAEWAAAHTALDHPYAVARLLDALREVGAHEQVTALLARDPATHTALDNPEEVAWLLISLREDGAHEQVTALAEKAAAHTALDEPEAVALLLNGLREVGAHEQVTALLARDPATHAALDHPYAVARLLDALREAGAHEQVTKLLARDPATHTSLDNVLYGGVHMLVNALREAGAHEQVTALAKRLPARGQFHAFMALDGNREQFRFGREPDGSAAPSWTWDDMD